MRSAVAAFSIFGEISFGHISTVFLTPTIPIVLRTKTNTIPSSKPSTLQIRKASKLHSPVSYGNIRIETYVTNFSNPEINMQTIVNFVINFILLSFNHLVVLLILINSLGSAINFQHLGLLPTFFSSLLVKNLLESFICFPYFFKNIHKDYFVRIV